MNVQYACHMLAFVSLYNLFCFHKACSLIKANSYLEKHDHGYFVFLFPSLGVMAFSQGAALAAMICALQQNGGRIMYTLGTTYI